MPLEYHILDVFTDELYAGNPLAVVLDADGMDAARCQAIAREFNLSETVFVSAPRDPVNTARLRIFTPSRELPFAGHPTVGTAALLAVLRAPGMLARQDLSVVLEETVGIVQCIVRRARGKLRASFTLPHLPEFVGEAPDPVALAAALSLDPDQIGAGRHRPSVFSAGVPFVLVPVMSQAAIAQVSPNMAAWQKTFRAPVPESVFVYCRETVTADAAFHARMFAPGFGMTEDPATGSAAAAFVGATVAFDGYGDGDHTLVIEQGYEMGRPSLITLGIDMDAGALKDASVGGGVVMVAQGRLL